MSWKTQIGIDQMHPAFTEFRYMDNHDTDECDRCHARGDHDDLSQWEKECGACAKEAAIYDHDNGEHDQPLDHYRRCLRCFDQIANLALHATFEFQFSTADVRKAEEWAGRNGYRYEDVNHLLHDAMDAGAIHPRGWKAA